MPRPTIKEVAKMAGVSPGTVSAVLNRKGFVSEALTRQVLAAVSELGYRPNHIARSLRCQSTQTVGIIIPTIVSPFFPPVLKEIDEVLSARGHSMLFANSKGEISNETALISVMRDKRVDGLLIVPSGPDYMPLLEELTAEGIPVVAFHSDFATGRLDSITWDDYGGSKAAVRHLIETGRRRIAIYSTGSEVLLPRLRGYEDALREAGMAFDPSLRLAGKPEEQRGADDRGVAMILDAARGPQPPDAVFIASSGPISLGVLNGARAAGIKIPDDLAMVVYDDYPWMEQVTPPLSALRRDSIRLGREAATLLLHRIQADPQPPRTVILPTELIVRASSRGRDGRGGLVAKEEWAEESARAPQRPPGER